MPGPLYVMAETVMPGTSLVLALIGGKLHAAGDVAGEYIGDAAEVLREGFRVQLREDGEIYEDDA